MRSRELRFARVPCHSRSCARVQVAKEVNASFILVHSHIHAVESLCASVSSLLQEISESLPPSLTPLQSVYRKRDEFLGTNLYSWTAAYVSTILISACDVQVNQYTVKSYTREKHLRVHYSARLSMRECVQTTWRTGWSFKFWLLSCWDSFGAVS